MTIAITGATGQLGRLVAHGLKARLPAADIIGLARSPEKATGLGIATRAFDYSKPDTLPAALTGVAVLLLISSNAIGERTRQHRDVIAAAKAAGVGRIVYTSLLRAETSPIFLAVDHRDTEAALRNSGLSYTILRNGWYTENLTGTIPSALARGSFLGSAGDGKISSAPRADYADAAVAALTGDGHDNQVYELAGDESYTMSALAAEVSRQCGRALPYKNLPEAEYAAMLREAGLPERWATGTANWHVCAAQGALFDDGHQLSKLIGRPTAPLAAVVAAALA